MLLAFGHSISSTQSCVLSPVLRVCAHFRNGRGAWDEEEDHEPESTVTTESGSVTSYYDYEEEEDEPSKRAFWMGMQQQRFTTGVGGQKNALQLHSEVHVVVSPLQVLTEFC